MRAHTRLAGFFLLAASAIAALVWAVERPWGFTPPWIAIVETVVQAWLGVCLLLFGESAVSAALAFVLLVFVYPVARLVLSLYNGHPVVQLGLPGLAAIVGGPLLFGVVRALPLLLLLAAAPTPRRRLMATIVFIFWLLLDIAARGLTMYSLQDAASVR